MCMWANKIIVKKSSAAVSAEIEEFVLTSTQSRKLNGETVEHYF